MLAPLATDSRLGPQRVSPQAFRRLFCVPAIHLRQLLSGFTSAQGGKCMSRLGEQRGQAVKHGKSDLWDNLQLFTSILLEVIQTSE
jgi:hypothetical protein